MYRMISTDVFEVVGVRPVPCIGVAARIAAPLPRSMEATSTVSRCRSSPPTSAAELVARVILFGHLDSSVQRIVGPPW